MTLPKHLQDRIEQESITFPANKIDEIKDATPSIAIEYLQYYQDGMGAGFLAGASFLYTLLKEERGEVAGVWVKAVKRPPGDEKHVATYHVRYINEDAEVTKSLCVFRGKHGFDFPAWKLEPANFEWLDTSTPIVAGCGELVKALESIDEDAEVILSVDPSNIPAKNIRRTIAALKQVNQGNL